LERLPRPPGSQVEQLLFLVLAAGLVSVPLVTVHLPFWARSTILVVVGAAAAYWLMCRLCPEIEQPANLHLLRSNPARIAHGFELREKHLLARVARRGANRRAATFEWTYVVANTGREPLRAIDMPLLGDVSVWGGDLDVAVSIEGHQPARAYVMVRDHYSPTIHIPLPHGGVAPGATQRIQVVYEADAAARVDRSTWILSLDSVQVGAPTSVSVAFASALEEEGTAYLIRRRGPCLRRVPLGSAEIVTDADQSVLAVRHIKQRGDECLIVDSALRQRPRPKS